MGEKMKDFTDNNSLDLCVGSIQYEKPQNDPCIKGKHHSFEARYNNKVYIYDICIKCGKIIRPIKFVKEQQNNRKKKENEN